MNKEYDVLQKKINLHSNEIQRIQGLTSKLALKKGIDEGELKRTKIKSRLENQIIMETKQIKQIPLSISCDPESLSHNVSPTNKVSNIINRKCLTQIQSVWKVQHEI